MTEELFILAQLCFLGIVGWLIGRKLNLPSAPVFGTIIVIGSLRILDVPLSYSPGYFSTIIQIFLGVFIGSRVNHENIKMVKKIAIPSFIIVVWALSIAFGFGLFISKITNVDLYSAILGSSVGGLPEMTVIAASTGADVVFVVLLQSLRIIITTMIFSFLFKNRRKEKQHIINQREPLKEGEKNNTVKKQSLWRLRTLLLKEKVFSIKRNRKELLGTLCKIFFTFGLASLCGITAIYFNIAAGGMLGSALLTIGISLLGLPIYIPPLSFSNWLLVGVGILVTDQIKPETLQVIVSTDFFIPMLISFTLTFLSSFLVAFIILKITNWRWDTCLLSSAPGGLTVMSTLALETGNDPFIVSLLHFCRLLALKICMPIFFTILNK